jgi:hypothetical protein
MNPSMTIMIVLGLLDRRLHADVVGQDDGGNGAPGLREAERPVHQVAHLRGNPRAGALRTDDIRPAIGFHPVGP